MISWLQISERKRSVSLPFGEDIEEVSQFVLKNISFFYIPTAVSIMESVGYLQGYMWQFALICIVSALLTFLATAYTVIGVMKLQEKIMANKGDKNG